MFIDAKFYHDFVDLIYKLSQCTDKAQCTCTWHF